MAFGKTYKFNPIPERLGILLVAYPDAGKSSLTAEMLPPEKIGVVIDADYRFGEVVRGNSNFVRMSDEPYDMVNPDKIYDTMRKNMPNKDVGLIVVDSVTAIIEPIILEIQKDIEKGLSKGARGYKKKADAMKTLQAALTSWGTDVIWVYHYRDFGDVSGTTKKGTSITAIELGRLWRNINLQIEIIVDENGKRGVRVLFARGGRTNITIWDDSGKWTNIRERLLQEVWGGLTQEEQEQIVNDEVKDFSSSVEAIAWAVEQGAFDEIEDHNGRISKAKNSLNKLYKALQEELGEAPSPEILYAAWRDRIENKLQTTNLNE